MIFNGFFFLFQKEESETRVILIVALRRAIHVCLTGSFVTIIKHKNKLRV